MLVHQLYRLADKLDIEVTVLLPEPAEIEELGALDDLPVSENVSLEQKQQIVRLLQRGKPPSPSGDQHGQTRRSKTGKHASS